ncbi:hypothetical protein K7X08_031807 [Anisodus acutangulus]|uniref:Uncharacterized protein n=1 Tax=Anisodus acutangulus TaxID=402998 RepID=A0A9Q1MLT0_9SOLA|nr:hypothetical protein K7X08_031807 [Anisodus acutangulus]
MSCFISTVEMDFHSLTRRELQALCKKNKIPANMTNVAMADALQSLEFVDGIEEVLKTCESEVANSSMESPGKSEAVMSVPRTSRRTTQRKTIKDDSETLVQTSTRSRCRTRGTVVRGVDEVKNDMLETPAVPTIRRRAATTNIRAKLESAMKECEPKEKIGDQIEEEKKDVPKTPAAAVLTSQRKEVKAKSSARQVYSTRRSVRLAGKPMQESSKQEDEKSRTLAFDAASEETDESLEVNSKNEELDKSGIDLKAFESLDINNESDTKSGQDSSTLMQNETDTIACAQQDSGNDLVVVALDTKAEEGSEEVALGHNNSGSEDVHTSEMKILENEKEMASGEMQCLDDDSGAKLEVSGEEPMEESDTKRDSDITNMVLTKKLHEQDEPHCGDTSDFDGEEEDNLNQMSECQVDEGAESNSVVAGKQELIGEPEVEAKVSASKQKCLTKMQANIDSLEVNLFGQFNDDVGEYDVDLTEANVDAPADALEVAGEEPMQESEVDHAKATVESAAYSLPPLASLIPDAAHEGECEVKVSGSQQCLHVSEANTEVAGEEPMEESDIDHAEANVDTSHASLVPNAATEPGQILVSDNKENLVYTKENKGTAGNDNKQSLENLSLRKLTKMLKDLQISKNPSGKIKATSSRSALQKLPENRLTSETEN